LEAIVIALAIGGLLTAHEIKAGAEEMKVGPARTVAVIAATPAAWLNHLLRIDRAWEGLRGWSQGFMDAQDASADVDEGAGSAVAATPTAVAPPKAAGSGWAAPRVPTNADPLDVYICGDSMSMDVGAAFVNVAVKTGCIESKRFYRSATGLSRPDAYDWPTELRREMGSTRHEAVIAMFGANDGQDVEYEGKVLKLYTPEWEALYGERVGEAMDVLTAGGQRLYWIGLPIPRSAKQAKKYEMMNRVYRAQAEKRAASVVYVDSWKLFSDASGNYSELLQDGRGKLVDMRKDDGIHFTMAGANRMASAVLTTICSEWGIPEP
ncbi:MAG: DUF459 domain-containing protein, partial [Actinobacteria bacterium]